MKKIKDLFEASKNFFDTRKGKVITISAAVLLVCLIAGVVILVSSHNNAVKVETPVKSALQVHDVTSVELNKTSLNLNVGSNETLNATITPENADDKTLMWTSSDKSIATVQDGLVTAQGEGNATVTATSLNGKASVCDVTVSNPSTASSSASSASSSTASSASASSSAATASKSTTSSRKTTSPSKSKTSTKSATSPKVTNTTTTKKNTTTATTSTAKPVNKEFYKTVDSCKIEYNPAYRSAQVFVDVTGIAKDYHGQDLNVKVYRNGTYDSDDSGNCGFICGDDTTIDCVVATNEKWVGNTPYAVKTSFRIECYHNDTHFKTISFTVDENGFC